MSEFYSFVDALKNKLSGLNIAVVSFDTTDSTNTRAKAYAADAADLEAPVLFIAKEQSAGRGRLGRDFLSLADSGIYMTLLYFTREELCRAVTVTTAVAVAAANAINAISADAVGIKWVNDIYSQKGKVAGILVESVPVKDGRAVAVGIGINVGKVEFPLEIRDIAASLEPLNADEKAELAARICRDVLAHAQGVENRDYMSDYRKLFILQNKTVDIYVSGEHKLRGVVEGVDDDGGLIVSHDGHISVLSSGEITVRVVK